MGFKLVIIAAVVASVRAGAPLSYAAPAYAAHALPYGYGAPIAAPAIAKYAAPALSYAAPAVSYAAPAPAYSYAAPAIAKVSAPTYAYAAPAIAKVAAPIAYAAPVAKTIVAEPVAPPNYEFGYAVNDPHTGDSKSQQETRHGDVVQGSYSLIDSDGTKRTVHYSADDHNGFNAVVSKEPIAVKAVAPAVAKIAAPALGYAAPAFAGHAYAAPAYAAPAYSYAAAPAFAKIAAPALNYAAPAYAKVAAAPAISYAHAPAVGIGYGAPIAKYAAHGYY
ncbi:hypothetical protein RN001_001817 [Aquatica leii]|uniref:Cuticle protein n=1 Tax=Aquatica leii TaxID=1421715 RepID=A0AAN7PP28_9COLE|nr:hypothetical protein RN001_001817 [Aquatica leii]